MKVFVLDANVALRLLLADDPAQSPKARALFTLAEKGAVALRLSHVTVAELVWVLTAHFEFERVLVAEKIRELALHDGIEIAGVNMVLDALDRFARTTSVDFPDCYAAACGRHDACAVTSYDRDFRKFTDVVTRTPDDILKELAK